MKTKISKVLLMSVILTSAITLQANSTNLQDIKKENRSVGDFSSIVFSISGELYLSQGDKNEVIIEADSDVLEKITTEVKGDALVIEFEKWYNQNNRGKVNIYITMKSIEKITLTGSGNILNKTKINSYDLELVLTGSGSINMNDLTTQNVKSIISGSGEIAIKSNTKGKLLDAVITGSGTIDASLLSFATADLTITGSGSISADVFEKLDAFITGSGKIKYTGKPLIDANITGSGKIVNGN
ncbi:MAG: head GIN domain-containing protein [Bacteroidales bacterium]